MKSKSLLTFFILLITFNVIVGSPDSTLVRLTKNNNWKSLYEFDDSVRVYTKKLPNKGVKAFKVSKITNIDRENLFKVFENVQNYDQILTSATKIEFEFIRAQEDTVYGHQHINMPIFKDRHYVYKLIKHSPSKSFSHLVFLDKDGKFSEFIKNKADTTGNPIYTDEGLGVFQVEELQNDSRRVSYSLYMDPGLKLPKFLINRSNRKGLVGMLRDIVKEAKKLDQE